MTIRAVFFDVGETLLDETRSWEEWADWLEIPHFTFLGVLGGVIARGRNHREVFDILVPGLDLEEERGARAAAGRPETVLSSDLYPDALPCLTALKQEGYLVGLGGNQPSASAKALEDMGLPVDVVASSSSWGVEKPSAAFFAKVIQAGGVSPSETAYVGDRLDNDVVPAVRAGMVAVFLKRGPWGFLQADDPAASSAHVTVDSLAHLPDALRELA